ncbi:protein kinase domain-containing protein [Vibrio kyushuensis]|uniref:protein kinase domain-containing protein n=1 Tax=Vibrio kyushuensis TaxID=2910249 RepID=UPI003D12EDE7
MSTKENTLVDERYISAAKLLEKDGYQFKRALREHVYFASCKQYGDVVIKFASSVPSRHGLKQAAEFLTRFPSQYWPSLLEYNGHKQIDWIIYPFITGQTLTEQLNSITDTSNEGECISTSRLNSLESAVYSIHKYGYVHCDIKPSNILLLESQEVMLLDFSSVTVIGTEQHSLAFQFYSPEFSKPRSNLPHQKSTTHYNPDHPHSSETITTADDWYSVRATLSKLLEHSTVPVQSLPSRYHFLTR